jgi:hypothetical protein
MQSDSRAEKDKTLFSLHQQNEVYLMISGVLNGKIRGII